MYYLQLNDLFGFSSHLQFSIHVHVGLYMEKHYFTDGQQSITTNLLYCMVQQIGRIKRESVQERKHTKKYKGSEACYFSLFVVVMASH